jgi:hypothetical protein
MFVEEISASDWSAGRHDVFGYEGRRTIVVAVIEAIISRG